MALDHVARGSIPDGQLLTGHVAEWGELLDRLVERRGLTVLVADPLSGTSALLAAALEQSALGVAACSGPRVDA